MRDFHLKTLILEISGKAFMNESEEEMRRVAENMIRQYSYLVQRAEKIAFLLWLADGSEIFEYDRDLDKTFEWCYLLGTANPRPPLKNESKYRSGVKLRTYRWLKRLNEILRETAEKLTGLPVEIGATLDNGPEFALSDFKYGRHKEIATASSAYPNSFVPCTAVLHADSQPYAAFPEGIPEGTTLGYFLGAQFREFSKDLGFDYLWLSNGMGFGLETWGLTGGLFDGKEFHPERAAELRQELMDFWNELVSANPNVCFHTRGSNYSAGIEMATDAAPLPWIYEKDLLIAPVNSPSSAIYYNLGLSITAWMSHIAVLPPNGHIPFRYYIHDPWFMNTPWTDRYARQGWDLYPILAIGRVNGEGGVETPDSCAFLSCDDSWGRMPDEVPLEVQPVIAEGFRNAPDQPGPLLWVYPFVEYGELTDIAKTFNEECFAVDLVQSGTPLNTVISSGNFCKLAEEKTDWFRQTIPVVPASALNTPHNLEALRKVVGSGYDAVVYGSINNLCAEAKTFLGLDAAEPLSGALTAFTSCGDVCLDGGEYSRSINYPPHLNGGGWTEIPAGCRVLAWGGTETQKRVLASVAQHGAGRIGFVRSLSPWQEEDPQAHNRTLHQRREMRARGDLRYPSDRLMRLVLAEFGWRIVMRTADASCWVPRLTISRNDNAFIISGYAPDTTTMLQLDTPWGAPVPEEHDLQFEEGHGLYHLPRAPYWKCRAFVKQQQGTVVYQSRVKIEPWMKTSLDLVGLKNAEVRYFMPKDCDKVRLRLNSEVDEPNFQFAQYPKSAPVIDGGRWEETAAGRCVVIENVTGTLNIAAGCAVQPEA